MSAYVARRPLTFTVLVMLGLEAIVLGAFLLSRLLGVPILALDLPILLLNAVVAMVLLSMLGWWRAAGLNAPSQWRNLHLLLVPLLLLLGPTLLARPELPAPGKIAALIVVTLLIGFQEEAIFRGVLIRALSPRGVLQAVLISAFMFGIIHANSLLVGRDALFVAAQIISSTLGAIGLGAIRVRINSIWPLVFVHALNDFLQFTATGGLEAGQVPLYIPLLKIGIGSILALFGLYLLRGEMDRAALQPVSNEPAAA
jgi:uncharacterized protein